MSNSKRKTCKFLVNGILCNKDVYTGTFNPSKIKESKYSQFRLDVSKHSGLVPSYTFDKCSNHCVYKDNIKGIAGDKSLIKNTGEVIRDYHDLDFCKKDSIKTRVEATCYPAYKSVMVPNDNEYRKDINSLLSKMKKDFDKEHDLHRSAINHIDECTKQRNLYTSAYINPDDKKFFYLPIKAIDEYYGHINIIPVFENYKSECITNLGNKITFDYDTYIMNISQKYGVDFKIVDCVSELSLLHKDIDFKKMHDYLINKLQTNIDSKDILNAIKVCQKLLKLNETCDLESYLKSKFTGKEWSDFINNYNELKELCKYDSDLRDSYKKQQIRKTQEQTRKHQQQVRRIQQQRVKQKEQKERREMQLATKLEGEINLQTKKKIEEEELFKKTEQQNLKKIQEKRRRIQQMVRKARQQREVEENKKVKHFIDIIFRSNGQLIRPMSEFLDEIKDMKYNYDNITEYIAHKIKMIMDETTDDVRLDIFYNTLRPLIILKGITHPININKLSFIIGWFFCHDIDFFTTMKNIVINQKEYIQLMDEFSKPGFIIEYGIQPLKTSYFEELLQLVNQEAVLEEQIEDAFKMIVRNYNKYIDNFILRYRTNLTSNMALNIIKDSDKPQFSTFSLIAFIIDKKDKLELNYSIDRLINASTPNRETAIRVRKVKSGINIKTFVPIDEFIKTL